MGSSVFLTKIKMIHMGLLAGIPRFPSLISTGYFLVLECTGISNMDVLECTVILLKGYTGKCTGMYWNLKKKLGGHPVIFYCTHFETSGDPPRGSGQACACAYTKICIIGKSMDFF